MMASLLFVKDLPHNHAPHQRQGTIRPRRQTPGKALRGLAGPLLELRAAMVEQDTEEGRAGVKGVYHVKVCIIMCHIRVCIHVQCVPCMYVCS